MIRRYDNQDNRWTAQFDHCEFKDGSVLGSIYGEAKSPDMAIKDFVEKLRGKKIVFHAGSTTMRREFNVPMQLAA